MLSLVWDATMENYFTAKFAISLSLSSLCIVLNTLLVIFIVVNKDFRNLKFCPMAIQAAADVIGPGMIRDL